MYILLTCFWAKSLYTIHNLSYYFSQTIYSNGKIILLENTNQQLPWPFIRCCSYWFIGNKTNFHCCKKVHHFQVFFFVTPEPSWWHDWNTKGLDCITWEVKKGQFSQALSPRLHNVPRTPAFPNYIKIQKLTFGFTLARKAENVFLNWKEAKPFRKRPYYLPS